MSGKGRIWGDTKTVWTQRISSLSTSAYSERLSRSGQVQVGPPFSLYPASHGFTFTRMWPPRLNEVEVGPALAGHDPRLLPYFHNYTLISLSQALRFVCRVGRPPGYGAT